MHFHCLFMTSCMISLPYLRVPSYNHSKVIDISCNWCRNVSGIDKFGYTINGYVCIKIVDGHSFL